MQRWQRIDRIGGDPNNLQVSILTRDGGRNTLEVRRESRSVFGPAVVDDTTALHCVRRYGFTPVDKPKRRRSGAA